jgi:uncharacterized SAM-binding protein YcdF (DUF218 family)
MSAAFYLKKLAPYLLFPVPLIATLLLLGLFFLWFGKRQRPGKVLVTCGTALLLLFANQSLSNYVLGSIEYQYHPLMEKVEGIRWIVVLGAGEPRDEGLPPANQLVPAGLYRTLEGFRLYKMHPGAKIIANGPSAMITQKLGVAEGIPQEDIIVVPDVFDTAEESKKAAEIVKGQPLILVTSASHMARALLLFRRQGMEPVPAPAEYLVSRGKKTRQWGPLSDGVMGLSKASVAVYSLLGRVWVMLAQ